MKILQEQGTKWDLAYLPLAWGLALLCPLSALMAAFEFSPRWMAAVTSWGISQWSCGGQRDISVSVLQSHRPGLGWAV